MKILFLDIDGVLNSNRTCSAFNGYPHDFSEHDMKKFDHVAIALIRKLCDDLEVKIVLSSDWRRYFPVWKVAESLNLPVIDSTAQDMYYVQRGVEIASWLNKHPEVTQYAIVDDIDAMLPEQKINFVKTNPDEGLTFNDYYNLQQILIGAQDSADEYEKWFTDLEEEG